MRKKILVFLLVSGFVQLTCFLYYWYMGNEDILRIECGDGELAVYYELTDRFYGDEDGILINGYQDEETGEYYLFFPADIRNVRCRLLLFGAEQLTVNGNIYATDSYAEFLEEGRYSLAANGSFYVLNVMYGSDIPSVFIKLDSENLPLLQESKENFDSGYLSMYDADGRMQYQDRVEEIHGRGNSSWEYQQQKGYAITLASEYALIKDCMSDKWNLIGNGYDHSLVENQMIYNLAEDVGLAYSPKLSHIDLYIDGEYVGVYLLTTKVRVAENSVAIDSLEKETELLNELPLNEYEVYGENGPEPGESKGCLIPDNPRDITGGYLIEQEHAERYEKEVSGFSTEQGNNFVIKSPEYASREQAEYIRGFVQEITDAITAEDGRNPYTGRSLEEYIDIDSFAKNYIIQEITKNMDMNLTSQFFYKPRGIESLLYAGPVWDFDYTFGMADTEVWNTALNDPEDLLAEQMYDSVQPGFTFGSLYQREIFYKNVVWIYRNEFRNRLQYLLDSGIDEYAARIKKSSAMNHVRWEVEEEYLTTVDNIKKFLEKRLEFLDSVW